MRKFLFVAAGMVLAADLQANLIVNGSFESGNTNFSSDYAFKATYYPPVALDAGQYQIVTNVTQAHPAWGSLAAQSGTNFLVANGSANTNLSPWMQTITVNPGDITTSTSNAPVYYRFQAYIANLYPVAAPKLSFEMSLNNSGAWQQLTTSSIADANTNNWQLTYRDGYFEFVPTTISFRLRNTETAAGGNDFAIDSIYFGFSTNAPAYNAETTPINSIGAITGGVVPEPGTWAAAALLIGTAGFVRWRRKCAPTRAS